MAEGPHELAAQGEGDHRQARPAQHRAAQPADGGGRQGLPFEGPDGQVLVARHVRGPPPADHLPLHVRARVGRRVPELHRRDGGDVARSARPPPHARHDLRDGVAAPLEKLEKWKAKHGWHIPWYSSFGTDFNYDFGVTIDESRGSDSYNFRSKDEFEAMGDSFFDIAQPFEMPGQSCFLRDGDGGCYHTYSQYAPWAGGHGRLVLLPRSHRARSPGGVGGAEGPQRRRPRGDTRLRILTVHLPASAGEDDDSCRRS